ncbi:DUF6248 family natural product biosynthesis protein [Nonomuraea sp. B19D2]|uniref:DUF6248 family natural product biosynthesis protein n=1 Tax=Nonomuraea sp. B19D2 TaxID=3159561 RepID=UPI0032DB9A23
MTAEMTEDDAAWVRKHVWTDGMRRVQYKVHPGVYTRCECQRDVCYSCHRGVHERCIGIPRQDREGMIAGKSGVHPACFKEPYKHVTIDGPPHATCVAQVWLADRICRWACRCGCKPSAPMSPVNAGWVRRNAWTKTFADRMSRQYGDLYDPCPCQLGIDGPPQLDRSFPEGWINGGIIFDSHAQLLDEPLAVWLADRTCQPLPKRVPPVAVPGGHQDALPGFDMEGTIT